jgi:hypothetical protein
MVVSVGFEPYMPKGHGFTDRYRSQTVSSPNRSLSRLFTSGTSFPVLIIVYYLLFLVNP